jgi:hypothetical protein
VTWSISELKTRVFVFVLILNEYEYEHAIGIFVERLSQNVAV